MKVKCRWESVYKKNVIGYRIGSHSDADPGPREPDLVFGIHDTLVRIRMRIRDAQKHTTDPTDEHWDIYIIIQR